MIRSPSRIQLNDVSRFSDDTWLKQETWSDLLKYALHLSYDEETGEAAELEAHIQGVLEKGQFEKLHSDLLPRARVVLLCLRYAQFTVVSLEENTRLLRESVLFAFRHDIELRDKIRFYFKMKRADETTVGRERRAFIQALRGNVQERIGTREIKVKGDPVSAAPTVKNWLRDYEHFFDEEFKVRGAAEEVHYMNQNTNVRGLSREDRALLLKLLQVYDYLFFPQAQVETETWGSLEERPALTATPAVKREAGVPRSQQQSVASPAAPQPRKFFDDGAVLAAAQSFSSLTGGQLYERVADTIEPKSGGKANRVEVLGALRVLAERGLVGVMLRDDRQARERVEQLLTHQLRQDLLSGFRLNQTLPVYVSLLLQYILVGKTGLPTSEAAEIVAGLLPLLPQAEREKYRTIVYYDVQHREWQWT